VRNGTVYGTRRADKSSIAKSSHEVDLKIDLRNRGIERARMFLWALLLLGAGLTWGIGLMMSPHGETVALGAEHVRTTVVTFKRNGAIGTVILCAIAAWLLFPRRRARWPTRDWTLIAFLTFMVGSSIYTLIWLRPPSVPDTAYLAGNFATTDMNLDWPPAVSNQTAFGGQRVPLEVTNRPSAEKVQFEPNATEEQMEVPEEQSDAEAVAGFHGDGAESGNNATDQNLE
jgi:hypothetical protein